ncbi:MAG TPA: tRNA lysidine(34) synthetase TilS [Anaerolineales bacterium]|nr:tRNA lysidine(34) synthetase TilS [Anaerolineales bacterium]
MLTRILAEACQLTQDRPVIVGVSGGPDSLYLLHRLWQLDYPVIAAYLNHGLRPEAEKEGQTVVGLAQAWGLPFRYEFTDVKQLAARQKLSIEAAARQARYTFLFAQAAQDDAQAVAVGHTADDQVETFLLHLVQGTGLAGLRGMAPRSLPNPWSAVIPLVRPLLDTSRAEIVAYLAAEQLAPIQDASNQDRSFLRNRIRLDLLPTLETYNPAIRRALWQTSQIVRQDYDLLEQAVASVWRQALLDHGSAFAALDRGTLQALEPAMARLLLRYAVERYHPGLREMGYTLSHRGADFILSGKEGAILDLPGDLYLTIEKNRLWIAKQGAQLPTHEWPQLASSAPVDLPAPGCLALEDGWTLTARVRTLDPESRQRACNNDDPFQAWFDLAALRLPLQVRPRRPGDRIQLLGMQGSTTKVSDVMINLKAPSRARARWPVVSAQMAHTPQEETVLWLPGLRQAEAAKLGADSQKALHLQVSPQSAAA